MLFLNSFMFRVGVLLFLNTNFFIQVSCDGNNVKSSLTFVIDDTGSMYSDIHQAKAASHSILDIAIRSESSQIENFILVTFNDPEVEKKIDTKIPADFEKALDAISVHGGGDCPEMALGGVEAALRASLPGSFLYVFSDASAKDFERAEVVRSLAQKKQSRVMFLLSGDCGNREYQDYQVYHQIAAVSSGQVFRLQKEQVSKVLESVPYLITGKSSVLTSRYLTKGCHTIRFNVDNRINDLTVSASGDEVKIEQVRGPGKTNVKLDLVVDTSDIQIARLQAPTPGPHKMKVCSPTWSSIVITAKTEFSFQHGFSEKAPKTINDTARQPIENTKSHLAIYLTDSRKTVTIDTVKILDLEEKVLLELPVERVREDFYLSNKFFAPKNVFKIAIKGYDTEDGITIERISKTAIETQKPYNEPIVRIDEGGSMEVNYEAAIVLTCTVLGFPEPNVTWTNKKGEVLKGDLKAKSNFKFVSKLKIDRVDEPQAYTCTATNKNGEDANTISVNVITYIEVLEKPADVTVEKGKDASLTCRAKSTPPAHITWKHKDSATPLHSNEDYQISGKSTLTIKNINEDRAGLYQCVIENSLETSTFNAKVTIA